MARQVFFDPFGKATEGYNLGMQQEQNLQSNVRQARQSDWDFNQMNPYRLAATQREDILGAGALPFQLQMPAVGLEAAKTHLATEQQPLAADFYRTTGMASPWAAVYSRLFGMSPTGRDAQGNISYQMPDQNGQPQNIGSFNPQTTLNQMNLPLQMEWEKNQAMNNYYNGMAMYGRGGLGAYTWDMARAGNLGTPVGQGASPVDRFFHPQTPAAPTQQGAAPAMGPYNLPQPPMPYQMPQQPNYNNMTPSQIDQGY
jgi:hypothetical protein